MHFVLFCFCLIGYDFHNFKFEFFFQFLDSGDKRVEGRFHDGTKASNMAGRFVCSVFLYLKKLKSISNISRKIRETERNVPAFSFRYTHTHRHTRKVMIGLMGNANEITTGGCVWVCVCVCVGIPSKSIHHIGRTDWKNIHHHWGQSASCI
jgi:hypothetical protein